MKKLKKAILIVLVTALIICLIPIPMTYKDGGTVRLNAVLYSVVFWHFLDGKAYDEYRNDPKYRKYCDDGYWVRTDVYFFPDNWREIDFFD